MKKMGIVCSLSVFLSGCAFISLDLSSGPTPFQEVLVFKDEQGPTRDKILLLEVEGVIMTEKEGGLLQEGRNLVSEIREKLQMAEKDPMIKGVLLRINSPGGTVAASDMIYEEIRSFKKKKSCPVVASFLDIAASGGYYVAMSADHILCMPTTVTGSIGVVMQNFGLNDLMEKVGVQDRTITSGAMKDAGSPFRPMRDEERALLQGVVDQFYGRFVSVVDAGRPNLDEAQVRKLADGRVYTGDQALRAGLVDQVGYLPDAIKKVKDSANLKGCRVVAYRRGGAPAGSIYDSEASIQDSVPRLLNELKSSIVSPQFLYLWCPGFSWPL